VTSPRRTRIPLLGLLGLAALAVASCSGADGPSLTGVMKTGASAIAGVKIPSGWTLQSASRSVAVSVRVIDGAPLDVTVLHGRVAVVGWNAVSPTVTSALAGPTCQVIGDRILTAKVATHAAEADPPFDLAQCARTISPDNPNVATNQGRVLVFHGCYAIDSTHCMRADVAVEGGASDRQALLQLMVEDRTN
jgi:hypothetical protein